MSLVSTRAVLLRAFPYGETSLILHFFTEDLGRVGVMARGARKRGGSTGSGLETFTSGVLTAYVKETRDLQTLKDFTPVAARQDLGRDVVRFGAASVLGELVLRHGGEASSPELFEALEQALVDVDRASAESLVPVVLARMWGVVATLGYHPVVDRCVACGRELDDREMGRFDHAAGGIRCGDCEAEVHGPRVGPGARRQLSDLLSGSPVPVQRPRAHLQLLSDFVTYHVSDTRTLQALSVLAALLPPSEADG